MEGTQDYFAFTASPVGEGAWMQTKEYGIINCLLQRITLKKDCLNSPISSPYGILTNQTTGVVAFEICLGFSFFFVVSLYDVIFPVVISFSKCRRWLSFLVVVGLLTVSSLCLRYCELEFCSVRSCSLVVV
jgi:hypothetical protein